MQRRRLHPARWLPRRPPWSLRSLGVVLSVGLVAAATLGGVAQLRVDTGIGSFLPRGDPTYAALQEKSRVFGGDPIVVLLESKEPLALLHDDALQRLLRLEGALTRVPGVAEVYGPATSINQVAKSAQGLVARITGSRDALRSQAESQARAVGGEPAAAADAATAEFDRRYGALLVSALPAGLPTLANPRFVDAVVFGPGGDSPRPQWQAVVPRANAIALLIRPTVEADQGDIAGVVGAVNQTVESAGLPADGLTVSGVPVVTASLSEQAQGEFPLLGAAAVVLVGGLYLAVPWTSRRRDRLRPLLATFAGTLLVLAVFGWVGRPLSLGVVAFLPVLLGIGSDFPLYLAQPSSRRRVLVAAGAGGAAFAGLAYSSVPFVRELGIGLALGMVGVVAVALVLRRWLDIPATEQPSGPARSGGAASRPPVWVRATASVIALVIAGLGWWALPRLSVEADPQNLARGLPALKEAEYAEQVLGASGEINVVLRGRDVTTPEALAWTTQAEDSVTVGFGDTIHPITTVSSLLRFLGPTPTREQIRSALELLPSYLSSVVITPQGDVSLLVLGIELQDLRDQRALLEELRAALPPTPPGYTVDVVGLPLAAASAYDAVSADRVAINLLAIVLAGAVLVIGLRERSDAARGLLTMVLAGGWVLAAIDAVAGTLSPLTVAVGALTAATACEFAVMLADARRHGRRWVVRSVALAAGAAVLGYLVLTGSQLAILREFGGLLAAAVVASCLAAALVVYVVVPPREAADAREVDGHPRGVGAEEEDVCRI